MTDAVVFVLTKYLLPDADQCIQYCLARGYHVIGLIHDDWCAAIAMLIEHKASVIVASSPERIEPDREPRVEYVAHDGPLRPTNAGPGLNPRKTRTQVIRRA